MKVVFMGTPDFAVPCLDVVVQAGHQVLAVVTQPDRPKGRGRQVVAPPVKGRALDLGLPVEQPNRIKTPEFTEFLRQLAPDVIVVVAFGQLLSQEILDIPRYGCINVHASLLPQYRGAAPIHWAVINGATETGVTTMFMDAGLDTGDMILKEKLAIKPEDTVGVVHDRLGVMGAELLSKTLDLISTGDAPRLKQQEDLATYAPLLTREHEAIAWQKSAQEIINQVRGMNPWPVAFTTYQGKVLKIWQATPWEATGSSAAPGTVVTVLPKAGLVVQAGQGQVLLEEVQPAGKKRMLAKDFLAGARLVAGEILGE